MNRRSARLRSCGRRRSRSGSARGARTAPPSLLDVKEVRHWSYPDYTRVVIELTRRRCADVHAAAAAARRRGRPQRLYLDLAGRLGRARSFAEGHAGRRRPAARQCAIGQNTERARARGARSPELLAPPRAHAARIPTGVVIDVYGARAAGAAGAPSTSPPSRRRATEPPRAARRAARARRRVVLDPGHGGSDPGAIGVGGLREKDVTLRLALALAEARGARLLGGDDAQRRPHALARGAHRDRRGASRGDVFVSLHANAAPRRGAARHRDLLPRREPRAPQPARGSARERHRPLAARTRCSARSRGCGVGEVSPQSAPARRAPSSRARAGLPREYRPVDRPRREEGAVLRAVPVEHAVGARRGRASSPTATEARRLRDDRYVDALAEQIARGPVRATAARQRVLTARAP